MKINQTEKESPSSCICNCVQGPMSDHIIFGGLDYLPLSLCLQELVSWYSKVLLNLLLEAFLWIAVIIFEQKAKTFDFFSDKSMATVPFV